MKMVVMGTRPEIIKLYPVIKELKLYVVHTGQHDELANQMIKDLKIKVHENLKVMTKNQSLTSLTIKLHQKLSELYERKKPEMVIVQGDTTTAMVAALEAYYHKIPVAHVEAGLRTDDIYSPFPEEVNRRIITQIAEHNFAPTIQSRVHAILQGWGKTYETGQTGIDTFLEIARKIKVKKKKKLLVTLHRRENIDKLDNIIEKIIVFLLNNSTWEAVWPVHPNPIIRKVIKRWELPENFHLIKPLSYTKMIREMKESSLILTDSGGIQEEAPSLGIPVIIARTVTERPEGVDAGFAKLLGDEIEVFEVPNKPNPYGDGRAGKRIAQFLSSNGGLLQ